jgi:hypothetical protein
MAENKSRAKGGGVGIHRGRVVDSRRFGSFRESCQVLPAERVYRAELSINQLRSIPF